MNAMDRALDRSMDAITRRAVRRMTAGKDAATILRIHEKARDLRAHRANMAFLGALYPNVTRRDVLRRELVESIEGRTEASPELEAMRADLASRQPLLVVIDPLNSQLVASVELGSAA